MAIENTNRIIKNETIFMEDDGGFATPIPISQEYIPSGLRTPPRPEDTNSNSNKRQKTKHQTTTTPKQE